MGALKGEMQQFKENIDNFYKDCAKFTSVKREKNM
jgi:hypothetical protein